MHLLEHNSKAVLKKVVLEQVADDDEFITKFTVFGYNPRPNGEYWEHEAYSKVILFFKEDDNSERSMKLDVP